MANQDAKGTGCSRGHDDPSIAIIDAPLLALGSLRKLLNGFCGGDDQVEETERMDSTLSDTQYRVASIPRSIAKKHVDPKLTTLSEDCDCPTFIMKHVPAGSPTVSPMTSDTSRVFWRSETSLSDTETEESDSDGSVLGISPSSDKALSLRRRNKKLREIPVEQQKSISVVGMTDTKRADVYVEVDLEKYMAAREMTPLQERINALTMIPPALFCLWFVLSGSWISKDLVEEARQLNRLPLEEASAAFENNDNCMDWSNTIGLSWLFQNLHAFPPLPLLASAVGVVVHAPFSFLYHWKYAHALTPTKRTDHWSRRMDQTMLHFSSAMTAFGTSGCFSYFLINAIFAADSMIKQFEPKVQPKRNQSRLGVAILAWTLPMLYRGEVDMFFQLASLLVVGLFLFVKYPVGGWSHALFHITLTPMMPLLMEIGCSLPRSQDHLRAAAQCFALA